MWLFKFVKVIDKDSKIYIRQNMKIYSKDDTFGTFYLMYKVHKDAISTGPVESDCANITNPLTK